MTVLRVRGIGNTNLGKEMWASWYYSTAVVWLTWLDIKLIGYRLFKKHSGIIVWFRITNNSERHNLDFIL